MAGCVLLSRLVSAGLVAVVNQSPKAMSLPELVIPLAALTGRSDPVSNAGCAWGGGCRWRK